jgi:hypothetical protein
MSHRNVLEVNGFSSFFDFSKIFRLKREACSVHNYERTRTQPEPPPPQRCATPTATRPRTGTVVVSCARVLVVNSRVVAGSQRGAERDGVVPRLPLTLQLHAYLLTLLSASRLRR